MVDRYNPCEIWVDEGYEFIRQPNDMDEEEHGDYVLYDDYARLEAENKALKLKNEVLEDLNSTLKNRISNALKTSEDLRNDLL
jgi:hypothetical protein